MRNWSNSIENSAEVNFLDFARHFGVSGNTRLHIRRVIITWAEIYWASTLPTWHNQNQCRSQEQVCTWLYDFVKKANFVQISSKFRPISGTSFSASIVGNSWRVPLLKVAQNRPFYGFILWLEVGYSSGCSTKFSVFTQVNLHRWTGATP